MDELVIDWTQIASMRVAIQRQHILADADACITAMTDTYSAQERQTWPTQLHEAAEILAGREPVTRYLSARVDARIAAGDLTGDRDTELRAMAQRVIGYAAALAEQASAIIAERDIKLAALAAAQTSTPEPDHA